MSEETWHNLGSADGLKDPPVREITIEGKQIALSFQNGEFGAVDNLCNHVGGPLGKGRLDGEYLVHPRRKAQKLKVRKKS